MTDVLSAQSRRKNMCAIRHRDTAIEQKLAQLLHQLAIHYRAQATELPGKPDFVIADRQAVILVNGCFWHHHDCHLFKVPATRTDFWLAKIAQNVERDKRTLRELDAAGFRVLTVWECALRGRHKLAEQCCQERLEEWLCAGEGHAEITTQGIAQKTEKDLVTGKLKNPQLCMSLNKRDTLNTSIHTEINKDGNFNSS